MDEEHYRFFRGGLADGQVTSEDGGTIVEASLSELRNAAVCRLHGYASGRRPHLMFRLITFVKRGTAADLSEEWRRYPRLEEAREAARALSRHERVGHVLIAEDTEAPAKFVEWAA